MQLDYSKENIKSILLTCNNSYFSMYCNHKRMVKILLRVPVVDKKGSLLEWTVR